MTTQIESVTVDAETKTEVAKLAEWTKTVQVRDAAERAIVYEAVRAVKTRMSKIADWFKDPKGKAKATHQAICDQESSLLIPLKAFENAGKNAITAFDRVEEEKRMAEQRRLQAEADEAARKERARLEREAAKLKTLELREERLAQAAAVQSPVIAVAPIAAKQEGESTRKIWKCKITNIQALIDAASTPHNPTYAANATARSLLVFDQQAANRLAVATKGSVPIPGVEFYSESSLAVR